MTDLITKIYLMDERMAAILWDDGLLSFFRRFFDWTTAENLDPEQYCGGMYTITCNIGSDEGEWNNLNPGDFIVAAYEVMTLWHEGKQGYELLSLLSINYTPSPMGAESKNNESVREIVEFLEAHFEAGGHV